MEVLCHKHVQSVENNEAMFVNVSKSRQGLEGGVFEGKQANVSSLGRCPALKLGVFSH